MSTVSERVDFIRKAFGSCEIDRAGENVAVSCPSCCKKGVKKKLSINLDTWQTHCWVCGLKGKTVLPILQRFCSPSYAETFSEKFLLKKISRNTHACVAETKLILPEGFVFLGDPSYSRDPDFRACMRYLRSRDTNERDVWYFKIGTSRHGRFRRRVIIPSFDNLGELNFFVARTIDPENKYKYINAQTDKRSIIFNEHNIKWNEELTIVEGPFDLMKCNQNATCLLGSSLSESMILFEKIISNRTPVLLALDADMGHKSQKIAMKLSSFDCHVRILDLDNKEDVGDMTKDEFKSARSSARLWSRSDGLRYKISEINSGSIT